jgi:hypothetical protein
MARLPSISQSRIYRDAHRGLARQNQLGGAGLIIVVKLVETYSCCSAEAWNNIDNQAPFTPIDCIVRAGAFRIEQARFLELIIESFNNAR